jgi:ring-1,2-phenylacetyl-CoA epoxidase subunit PaaE
MKLLVKDVVKETNDAVSICFKNGNLFKKVKYKPGQFVTLHFNIDNQTHKRAYSFSSNPYTDKDLKVTIKKVDKGLVSNYVHNNLKVGDKLDFDNPTGMFYVEPKNATKKQYVLFAAGSGITPMFSIVKSVLSQDDTSKILLIYANKDMDSIIFHKEVNELQKKHKENFAVEHIIGANKSHIGKYHKGRVSGALLNTIFSKYKIDLHQNEFMICGPSGYMDAVQAILQENNIAKEKIKLEAFKAKEVEPSGKNLSSSVTLKYKGKDHVMQLNGDKSILQQAMSNNVALPYSCKSGMCSTCKARCVEGKIKMTEGHFLPQKEVDAGNILTCISYAESEKIVLEI